MDQLNLEQVADQASTSLRPSTITLVAQFNCTTGYGSMGEYLALGLARNGATVNVVPLLHRRVGLTAEMLDMLDCSQPDPSAPTIFFHWLVPDYPVLDYFRTSRDLFIYTTFEGNQLPSGWLELMNSVRAVIVPTHSVAAICRMGGVVVPVEVLPQGIDPEIYHYEERPERTSITTLMVGPMRERKHVQTGIAAWKQAFADDPHARLILKSNYGPKTYVPDDPRIEHIFANEPTRGIAHWYQRADVLLALGNEGFGLPLVEAMATGLPVIALNSEGQADVCQQAQGCLLPIEPTSWGAACSEEIGPSGIWGIPAIEDVAQKLRWVAQHREEARAIGRMASRWAIKHRNVWTMGSGMLNIIERYRCQSV